MTTDDCSVAKRPLNFEAKLCIVLFGGLALILFIPLVPIALAWKLAKEAAEELDKKSQEWK